MAVPKKRQSRQKKNSRRATWIRKANKQATRAYSLANSVLKGKSTSFIYAFDSEEESTEEEEQFLDQTNIKILSTIIGSDTDVAELVDALDLGSSDFCRVGSSPSARTKVLK